MTNEDLGDLLHSGHIVAAPIGDLIIAEERSIRRMLQLSPGLLPLATKDVQGIQIDSLNSVIDPNNEVELVRRKCLANAIILSLNLRDHIIAHQNDDIPLPLDFIHIGIAGFNLGLVRASTDLLPGNFGKICLCAILHRGIVGVARNQNAQLLRMIGKRHPFAKIGLKLDPALSSRALEKDVHCLLKRHTA